MNHSVEQQTVEQQMLLNVNRYDVDEVSKMFSKKELAKVLVATTCWSESISKQYKEFKTKIDMINYLIYWLDDCFEDLGRVEDLVEFINENKD